MRTWGGRAVVALLLVLSAAGAFALNRATRQNVLPAVTPGSASRGTSAGSSPRPMPSPLARGGGAVIPAPQSAGAVVGTPYSARLLAACMVLLDFDGRFWTGPSGLAVREPVQPGTVTLLAPRRALYRTASGQSIPLRPVPGPITLPACP